LARCLIIGCGCRGRSLARELRAAGHAVRGTTRSPERAAEIEAAGAEPFIGDPDVIATIAPSFDHVSIACVLLGSARGPDEAIAALHGTRLEMLLARMIDTTVRAVAYEVAGSVSADVLAAGARLVADVCSDSRIPFELLDRDPADASGWLEGAVGAVSRLLDAP
jgi:predicted dinucleotide-binding enzyme